jgi:hypothetical protein
MRGPVKSLLIIVATMGLAGGGCGTTEKLPMPQPSTVSFALRNDGAPTVYLFQDCLLDLTINRLSGGVTAVIQREGPCACDCNQASCPVCGPCFQGSRDVAGGGLVTEYWSAVSVTHESTPTGTCERKIALPGGLYRIDVPVYASAEDAAAQTNARLASQDFVLPAPNDSVSVALGVFP